MPDVEVPDRCANVRVRASGDSLVEDREGGDRGPWRGDAGIVLHRVLVIARVHGVATSADAQLVASCDLAVSSDVARFATPGVAIGLFCSTPVVALSRDVHPENTMEKLLTGELIDAAHAERLGLIDRSVPAEDLDVEVAALAERAPDRLDR